MTHATFSQTHTKLRAQIVINISHPNTSSNDKDALPCILRALDGITYGNRLRKKGMLSHMVADTLDFNNPIGEEIILFYRQIN
jgi:hypothetical protein